MKTFRFDKTANLLIYGYGPVGQKLHHKLVRHGYRVTGIIDRNADRPAPVDNCLFIKPEQLGAESSNCIIILTLQNILEHERVVKMLANKGAQKIVYLNSTRPELHPQCFALYNQLIYGSTVEDFDFPLVAVELAHKPTPYYREETESIVVEIPAPLLFCCAESQGHKNINIAAFKQYNALYDVVLRGKSDAPEDFRLYCDTQCGSGKAVDTYLQDRLLLTQMLQAQLRNGGLSFFRNAPCTARWNEQTACFHVIDGHHRASFLVNSHINTIPVRISKEDYELWYNSEGVDLCKQYMEAHGIETTYTPILHPAFASIEYSAERGGRPTAGALYQFFKPERITKMRVLDANSGLSYFAQMFARMGAKGVVSVEPREELLELAKLLNRLHYTDSIEMHNTLVEELDARGRYDVVLLANDVSPDPCVHDAGKQMLRKIDSLSTQYFISRSNVADEAQRRYVLANSAFQSYQRLNIEIIAGHLSEIGVYTKNAQAPK
jgi:hypothetical protein